MLGKALAFNDRIGRIGGLITVEFAPNMMPYTRLDAGAPKVRIEQASPL